MSLLRTYIRKLLSEANYQSHTHEPEIGDIIINTNPQCTHKGSIGEVIKINELPSDSGKTASYKCINDGSTWNPGDILEKTLDQLSPYNKR
jgi:hypothetical protein